MEATVDIKKLIHIAKEVSLTLSEKVDELEKESSGFVEITFGIAEGVKTLLCALARTNNPRINADPLIKLFTVWLLNGIENNEEDVERALQQIIHKENS